MDADRRAGLVPHPGLDRPEAIARDYGMGGPVSDAIDSGTRVAGEGGGEGDSDLQVRLRAALCGYALLHWSADATADHSLDPARHHLWLRNRAALYGVENLSIAPGAEAQQDPGALNAATAARDAPQRRCSARSPLPRVGIRRLL